MGNYNDSYELMHYGVKGMKWGVRRKQKEDRGSSNTGQGHSQNNARNKKSVPKYAKIAAFIAGTITVSYAGVKFSTDPHVRAAMGKVLQKIGDRKISDLDPFEGYTIIGKDGSPLNPSAIKRLQDLGVL